MQALQPDLIAGMSVPRMAEEPIRLVPAGNGADRYRFRWSYRQPLLAVFVAAALALLVACANIANLMFARASARPTRSACGWPLGPFGHGWRANCWPRVPFLPEAAR